MTLSPNNLKILDALTRKQLFRAGTMDVDAVLRAAAEITGGMANAMNEEYNSAAAIKAQVYETQIQ